jgi:hypothetical protein
MNGTVALAEENARLNGREGMCSFIRADAFELLRSLSQKEEWFGTVILDPPAFVKSRKKLPEAIKGYLTINRRAMELVEHGGWLFSCSCSHHLDRETFLDLLRKAAQQSRRTVRLVAWWRCGARPSTIPCSCPAPRPNTSSAQYSTSPDPRSDSRGGTMWPLWADTRVCPIPPCFSPESQNLELNRDNFG